MAKLFKDGREPPPQALRIIVSLFHRVTRPLYMGVVSLEIGWGLQHTQEMFDLLEERGEIRPATLDEKRAAGMSSVANAYVLVGARSLSKAHW